jgi:hypothetical protein
LSPFPTPPLPLPTLTSPLQNLYNQHGEENLMKLL